MPICISLGFEKNMGEIMLNQERVCEMTKLAIFDQKKGREYKPMTEYFRRDYIARELLKSFITGTMAFAILVGAVILYDMEGLLEQINSIDIRQIVTRGILCYAACMAVYFLVTYIVYYMRYTKGRHEVKKYYLHLKKVNKIYREEEQI
jgi:hypothetical protein